MSQQRQRLRCQHARVRVARARAHQHPRRHLQATPTQCIQSPASAKACRRRRLEKMHASRLLAVLMMPACPCDIWSVMGACTPGLTGWVRGGIRGGAVYADSRESYANPSLLGGVY